jgi:hypothetical protein
LIVEAQRLASSGQIVEAGSLLQAAVHELAQTPGDHEQRRAATEMLLELLFREGRDGRMSKVFRQYVADCSPYRDPEFDELYLAGVLATRTSPVPLRRRPGRRVRLLPRPFVLPALQPDETRAAELRWAGLSRVRFFPRPERAAERGRAERGGCVSAACR